ncbi:FixH family protein [Parvularcula sp. IMCC14364]|uniref:FixH family protein n=1 Tax=Parvularcula sp. IMCC14364 TaxID=3067902 RepID=UPI002740AFFC|nr:FixH family protein [Parvularcula sp. IMCC14364]
MTAQAKKQFELTGWHVLIAVIIFFTIIASVNAVMITLALKSFPGEEQKKSYMQGLQYNEVLAERDLQESLGWQAILYDGDTLTAGNTSIRVRLVDAENTPLQEMTLEATLGRPATDERDITPVFRLTQGNLYEAQIDGLEAGVWDLKAVATAPDGTQLTFEKRLWLR